MSIKSYGIEVSFNGITSLLNFIKIYQFVQKLMRGRQTRRKDYIFVSLYFSFRKGCRLKIPSYIACKNGYRNAFPLVIAFLIYLKLCCF